MTEFWLIFRANFARFGANLKGDFRADFRQIPGRFRANFGQVLERLLKEFWCNFRGFLGFFGVLKGLLAGKTCDPLPTGFRDFGAILGAVL